MNWIPGGSMCGRVMVGVMQSCPRKKSKQRTQLCLTETAGSCRKEEVGEGEEEGEEGEEAEEAEVPDHSRAETDTSSRQISMITKSMSYPPRMTRRLGRTSFPRLVGSSFSLWSWSAHILLTQLRIDDT